MHGIITALLAVGVGTLSYWLVMNHEIALLIFAVAISVAFGVNLT